MPQMAPINWLSLFFMMCLTFLMFNLLNYFSFNTKINKYKLSHNNFNNNFSWKW